MFQYVRKNPQPSTLAASSSSPGNAAAQYWRIQKMPNALAAAGTPVSRPRKVGFT
jgi:hypothetical protein